MVAQSIAQPARLSRLGGERWANQHRQKRNNRDYMTKEESSVFTREKPTEFFGR